MRQVRHQAHELADHESQIARDLDALNHSDKKTLDDSAQRQALIDQMARQQGVLTNILGRMRAVTERAELTEPLLAKQLYDILRRADQTHTENQLEIGERLLERGFLPQASQAERSARQNIEELRQSVDTAAQSVLGSETESLRYAQKELDDLSRQLAKETAADTNAAGSPPGEGSAKPPGETGSSASPTDAKLAGARSGAGSATSPTEASSPEAAPRPGSAESRAGAGRRSRPGEFRRRRARFRRGSVTPICPAAWRCRRCRRTGRQRPDHRKQLPGLGRSHARRGTNG